MIERSWGLVWRWSRLALALVVAGFGVWFGLVRDDGAVGAARSLSILVLGDSYSAGNGAGDYYGPSGCRRSGKNYAEDYAALLRQAPFSQASTVTNAACSGATTSAFFTSWNGQPPQIDAVNGSFQLVLLTIGGNDVHFADIVQYCLVNKTHDGYHCLRNLDRAIQLLHDGSVTSAVTHVLSEIHGRDPSAKIVLLGYPYLEGDESYELVDRGEGSASVTGDTCGDRSGSTNLVTVGKCVHEIGDLGDSIEQGIVDQLNSSDSGSPYAFVSTQRLFVGTQPGFTGPNHELYASHVNPNRWFIQPFVDADSGAGTLDAAWGGSDVFYHPNPTGWEEEARLLVATPQVPKHSTVTVGGSSELRLDGVGPLDLGMNVTTALNTGWLAGRASGCDLGGNAPVTYRLAGPRAPSGLLGTIEFADGRLDDMWFTAGVHTALGTTTGRTTDAQMVSEYVSAGYDASATYDPVFGTFVAVKSRGRLALEALSTGHARVVTILAIPSVPVCD